MYKVPASVLQECRDNLQAMVNHIEKTSNLDNPSVKRRLKRVKKNIQLLNLNYVDV